MINSCVDDCPLFHEGSPYDRARAFLKELHSVAPDRWTSDDKYRRQQAMLTIQWVRKKTWLKRGAC